MVTKTTKKSAAKPAKLGTATANLEAKIAGKKASATEAPKAGILPTIVSVKGSTDGVYTVVKASNGEVVTIKRGLETKEFKAAAVSGKVFHPVVKLVAEITAADKAKHPGKLAAGLDGRSAPHSSKAVADARVKDKPAAKAATAPAKKQAKAAAKAEKAAPKADDNRKITLLDKKFTYGKDGTSRRSAWGACAKSKTVADYAAAGGALKYLPRWVAAGAIKLG